MESIKVIALCSSSFAYPILQQMVFLGQLGAVIVPERSKSVITEVNELLRDSGVPVITVNTKNFPARTKDAIQRFNIEAALVLTFPFMVPQEVYALPSRGFFNVHPGLLPGYRGPDPIFYQVRNREKLAGVTIHKVSDEPDAGDIVLQEAILLDPLDTYGMLAGKLSFTGAKLVMTLLKILSMGFSAPSKPQDEKKAHYYKRQTLEELAIHWEKMDADTIIALIHACNPHNKGAATKINNKLIHFLHAEKYDSDAVDHLMPGTILSLDDESLEVSAIQGEVLKINFLYIEEGFVPPSYLKRWGILPNMRFESVFP